MGLNMPEGESSDNKSGIDVDRAEKMHGQFPNDGAKLRTQFLDYLTTKVDEIEEQKDSRRYYHGAQYTPEQINTLRRRGD
jgi:hypothetical protein